MHTQQMTEVMTNQALEDGMIRELDLFVSGESIRLGGVK